MSEQAKIRWKAACKGLFMNASGAQQIFQRLVQLDDDLIPLALIESILRGSAVMAEQLLVVYPDLHVEVFSKPGEDAVLLYRSSFGSGEFEIKGEDALGFLALLKSGEEAGNLFRAMMRAGAAGALSAFGTKHRKRPRLVTLARYYECRLPFLNSGAIHDPELLLALDEASAGLPIEWFDETLCWATPDMVAAFPNDLTALRPQVLGNLRIRPGASTSGELCLPIQNLSGDLAKRVLVKAFTADEESAGDKPSEAYLDPASKQDMLLTTITLTLAPEGRALTLRDRVLLNWLVPENQRMGMQHNGRVLCRTTMGFLKGFQMMSADPGALRQARDALNHGFPLHEAAWAHTGELEADTGFCAELTDTPWPVSTFAQSMFDFEGSEELGNLLPAEVLDPIISLLERERTTIEALNWVGYRLRRSHRIRMVWADKSDIINAFHAGCRLPPAADVIVELKPGRGHSIEEVVPLLMEMAEGPLSINGESCDIPIEEALEGLKGLRVKTSNPARYAVLKSVLLNHGIDAAIPLLRTKAQWRVAVDVFSPSDLEPHAAKVPTSMITVVAAGMLDI
ncbi:hypothetical protein HNP46_006510 [Pseudomonas nitritireducens]|uniref:Uncharacterized protein n=1 Tax=Pseudomonas nitroreducens TaxID=46680 RepID=A0A7W7KRN8_PSENT|nr:hypothetical protein [Pseudomonas nitritireducens]MBB4867596.1 hypothetical protein [Pseudomonas nitritireducens]